jgi:2-polyprenyl-3-methyl-5-hydroxy-6-metoxy-1,4-benzoquinol methylase
MRQNIYDSPDFFKKYLDFRELKKGYNEAIEEPAMWSVMPELSGATVLDIGCGFGVNCARLADSGASEVIGVDISKEMLAKAWALNNHDKVTYLNKAAEDIDFAPNTFDIVVSSLSLHYVIDYAGVVSKVFNCLKEDGNFIFSVEHPVCTCRDLQQWITDDAGNKLFWPIDQYSFEGKRSTDWFVNGVIKYHRTIETYVMTLVRAGFEILHLAKPTSSETFIKQNPSLQLHSRRPPILLIKTRKK